MTSINKIYLSILQYRLLKELKTRKSGTVLVPSYQSSRSAMKAFNFWNSYS